MGNSCCSRHESDELPKPPVRQPSDGDVKVKTVENLSSIQQPDGIELHQTVDIPVSKKIL